MVDGGDNDGRGFEVSQKAFSTCQLYPSQAHKGTKKVNGLNQTWKYKYCTDNRPGERHAAWGQRVSTLH